MLKPLEVLKLYPAHDYTLNGALASRAQRDPARPFILFAGKSWSWAEFTESVATTARLLVARHDPFAQLLLLLKGQQRRPADFPEIAFEGIKPF